MVGNNKCKLSGLLVLLLVIVFGNDFRHIYTIVVGVKKYTYKKNTAEQYNVIDDN